MCELIYEVLTLGPERISILLGKCFPLGSVSATAYRCLGRTARGRAFPTTAWMKKHVEASAPAKLGESDLRLLLGRTLLSTNSSTGRGFQVTHTLLLVPFSGLRCILLDWDSSRWQLSSDRCRGSSAVKKIHRTLKVPSSTNFQIFLYHPGLRWSSPPQLTIWKKLSRSPENMHV